MFNFFRVVAETYRRVMALSSVDTMGSGGWFSIVREAWGGAWQANVAIDAPKNILAFSAVYSCVTIIASDIAKLRIKLMEEGDDRIYREVDRASPFLVVLKKPNSYQTWLQFAMQWIAQKLMHGNVYVLKVRESTRRIVKELYVLDSTRVRTLVSDDGDVFYQLSADYLSGVAEATPVPAREIIHDRMPCLFHPLVGVTPIYACGMSATMGNKIQANSARFFKNMSRPSGHLTAPGKIDPATAAQMKKDFDENYGGDNIGRVMVTGSGLEYKPFTSVNAADAQLIEQLKWTVEDVARAFHMPLFKLGGQVPAGSTVEALNLMYYQDCLQSLIESFEASLDEGLELPDTLCTEFDLDGLLRMDLLALIKAEAEAVKGGIKSPDESRKRLNLPPVPGGDTPYLQQQNYSLGALAKRDAKADPFATTTPAPQGPPPNAPTPAQQFASERALFVEEFSEAVMDRLRRSPLALPAPAVDEDAEAEALAQEFTEQMRRMSLQLESVSLT